MPAKVILNPYSNRWNAKKRWPETEAALKNAGVDFSLAVSEHPRQPVDLAEQAVKEGFSPIIVAGGDGTIGDTINGIGRVKKGGFFPGCFRASPPTGRSGRTSSKRMVFSDHCCRVTAPLVIL